MDGFQGSIALLFLQRPILCWENREKENLPKELTIPHCKIFPSIKSTYSLCSTSSCNSMTIPNIPLSLGILWVGNIINPPCYIFRFTFSLSFDIIDVCMLSECIYRIFCDYYIEAWYAKIIDIIIHNNKRRLL